MRNFEEIRLITERGLYGGGFYGGTLPTYDSMAEFFLLQMQTLRWNLQKCGLYGRVLVKTRIIQPVAPDKVYIFLFL